MLEKILVLTRDKEFGEGLRQVLSKAGVDVIGIIHDPTKVNRTSLGGRYNVIVVDKWFCGNAMATARFILRLRKVSFRYPILGIELSGGSGSMSHLQIAGCNFILQLSECVASAACERITQECLDISVKLESALSELELDRL